MTVRKSNPLAKVIVGVLILVVGFFVVQSKKGSREEVANSLDAAEQGEAEGSETIGSAAVVGGTGDADATVHTLNTLVVGMQTMENKLKQQANEMKRLRDENQRLEKEQALNQKQLVGQLSEQKQAEIQTLTAQLFNVQENLDLLKDKIGTAPPPEEEFGVAPGESPATSRTAGGLNIPQLRRPGSGGQQAGTTGPATVITGGVMPASSSEQLIWIKPMDAKKTMNEGGEEVWELPEFDGMQLASYVSEPVSQWETATTNQASKLMGTDGRKPETASPRFTIPENATLLGSKTMTALIGRIPVGGAVVDPYRFKIMVGRENLATNGLNIPGVEGVVMSGIAKGDYTMQCASGEINSMTFTFSDGRIHTVGAESGGAEGGLGYITDPHGVPCLSGTYITNLPEFLAQTGGLTALSAVADAYAEAQVTNVVNSDGTSGGTVTGNSDQYALGKAGADGVGAMVDVLSERQQSAYDAVFVPLNTKIDIHITTQIDIDYDTAGRKLAHAQTDRYGANRNID